MAPGLLPKKNIYFLLTAALLFTEGAPVILSAQDKAGNTTEKSERLTEAQQKEGSIKGTILDYETKKPLEGVKLVLLGTERQASSDAGGRFVFSEIQVGTYRIECSLESFYSFTRSDILVRPRRTTYLNLELYAVRALKEEVSVTADYFPEKSTKPGSREEFTGEEMLRNPGSINMDLSRALNLVPGIVVADDSANDLLIRGGSPMENGFYVDNIPIININHFPQQGASGGNISMLNLDFVDKVEIFTGGFDASYGNRLSSIIDISYRKGDPEQVEGQVNFSFIGFGAALEGPLPGKKGSFMFSAYRSFLDLLQSIIDPGDEAGVFYDIQGKITYDLDADNQLSLLMVGGHSQTLYHPGFEKFGQFTLGMNWRRLWGGNGYSDTSLSFTKLKAWEEDSQDSPYHNYDYNNGWMTLRNVNHLQFSTIHKLKFGFEAQRRFFQYENISDDSGRNFNGIHGAAFVSTNIYLFSNLSVDTGLRLDYIPFSKRYHFSPRFSFCWTLTDRLSINGSAGLFYQQMSMFLLKQHPDNTYLKDPRARHLVLGLRYLIRKDVQMTLNIYDKQYRDMPMAVDYPYYYPFDNVAGDEAIAYEFGQLVDSGKAYARGVEFSLQKKMSGKLYGFISLTYFRTRFRDLMGAWHSRIFNNRFIICVSGGYKPNKKWEFNLRWTWGGNRAFTPVNENKSTRVGYAWIPVENIYADYLDDYRALSLFVERRLSYRSSTLVLFAGAWNIFGKKNELYRWWDSYSNQYMSEYMWEAIPYIGLKFEF